MTTLWSGRFDAPPDPAAFEFGKSFRFDRRMFEEDVTGSIAWARALARAGVLPPAEADSIEKALKDIRERGRAQLCRACARRTRRRCRTTPPHGTIAQRTGVGRPPAVSDEADPAAAERRRGRRRLPRHASRVSGRRADA